MTQPRRDEAWTKEADMGDGYKFVLEHGYNEVWDEEFWYAQTLSPNGRELRHWMLHKREALRWRGGLMAWVQGQIGDGYTAKAEDMKNRISLYGQEAMVFDTLDALDNARKWRTRV